MSRAKALLECLAIMSPFLDRLLIVVVEAAADARAGGLALPPKTWTRSAEPQFLRVSALRDGTLTDVKSTVIMEQNAIFVHNGNLDVHDTRHTRPTAAWGNGCVAMRV